ncbi:MAG: hypothetical protein ACKOF9_04340 [Burkholderiales bacterium]
MELQYAQDPTWADAAHTKIDLTIKWVGIAAEYPFTASQGDTEAHGRGIFDAAVAGEFGPIADYVAPPPPPPPPPPQFTSLEFLDLFTEAEQLAVATASMQSVQAKLWYDRTLAASFVTIADPRTEAGLDALVASGLLTAPRKAEIVAAMS